VIDVVTPLSMYALPSMTSLAVRSSLDPSGSLGSTTSGRTLMLYRNLSVALSARVKESSVSPTSVHEPDVESETSVE